ncbi:MAG: two-component system, NarL family, nitrate/nitrite response regulator NarL, partial [Mycobacterium sp.]|nr:two-component system, NarL family, nitrate/nitrite response regulator NarL [Mycobacterium sp.]
NPCLDRCVRSGPQVFGTTGPLDEPRSSGRPQRGGTNGASSLCSLDDVRSHAPTCTRAFPPDLEASARRGALCEAGGVTGEKVRVVVGDDHPLFRDGVVRALTSSGTIDVVAEADDGVSALAAIREHGPQVALLDYRMPGLDGAQVAAAVRRDELPTRVLLISAHDESAIVYSALQEGATGFISKESSRSELIDAVLSCAKGRDVVAPNLAAGLVGEIQRRNDSDTPTLSAREREVLGYIANGQTIPAMAKEMFLAPSTVKTHVQRLYEKLGVGDRGAAVAEAMRRGLLE